MYIMNLYVWVQYVIFLYLDVCSSAELGRNLHGSGSNELRGPCS